MKNTNNTMRVCVISPEIVGPHNNGGIGTHSFYLSVFLSRQLGQKVTFIYTGSIEHHDEAYWRKWFMRYAGIEFIWVAPAPIGDNQVGDPTSFVRTSALVYEWLRERSFEVCHFQEMLGNGFRCFQAKRLGLAFANTLLTCTVHSSWEWINQAMQDFPKYGRTELESKFMERYSIEHCDVLISPSHYMLEWVAKNRVPVHAPQHVLPYLFDPEVRAVGSRPVNRHVIFFGRLEVRKGILIFLDALRKLAAEARAGEPPIRVTFLGRAGHTPDGNGRVSVEKASAEVTGAFTLELQTNLGHQEAMEFLAKNNDALVVCPSLVDNSPYAIIECLELGLNIIAARSGGIPELFDGDERLFAPTADDLVTKLRAGLANQLPAVRKRFGAATSRELWTAFCGKCVPSMQAAKPVRVSSPPEPLHVLLVGMGSDSVVLETLRSLELQSEPATTVTNACLRNGESGGEIDSICAKHGWRLLPEDAVPELAPGSLVLVLRCGARLERGAIARLRAAMQFSRAAALSCRGVVTFQEVDLRVARAFEPLGACLEGGILYNAFGDGAVITRGRHLALNADGLKRLADRNAIWCMLAGFAAAGEIVDVLPESLVSFRREDGAFTWEDLDYTAHMQLLHAVDALLPDWVRHTLVNMIAVQRNAQVMLTPIGAPKARRSIGYKIRREARRIFRQIGIGSGNGNSSGCR